MPGPDEEKAAPSRAPYLRREDYEASLPVGVVCGDCVHFRRCRMLFGAHPQDETCDWVPIRFVPRCRAHLRSPSGLCAVCGDARDGT